ncbi:hypothetical protein HPB49_015959 [Dermacentor silvarum]|uniref:Uncharacterized protein n=1 Tax=Dermacentor silvarum TaxID=543639 RepID=A0ACB8C4D1_DERSI|nr:hypothetical protein HPB49_015959 [Dermacentor silvarum]
MCPHCGDKSKLYHITWACQHNPAVPPRKIPPLEQWESALTSPALENKLAFIVPVCEVAASVRVLY